MVVLVAYATDHGSTRGVADRIASRLQLSEVGAEACAVADVLQVSRYEAVVLGSAIHGGKWLPETRQFADRNAALLRESICWVARHTQALARWQTPVAGWRRPTRVIPEAVPGPPRYRCAPKKPIKIGVITSGGAL